MLCLLVTDRSGDVHPAAPDVSASHSWILRSYEFCFGIAACVTSCVSPLDEDEYGERGVAEDEEEHLEQPVLFVVQLSGQNLKEGDEQEGAGGESLQHH